MTDKLYAVALTGNVRFDGKIRGAGTELEDVPETIALEIEALGVGEIEEIDGGGERDKTVSEEEIVQAIQQLDKENPDQFTKGGKPEVKVIEEILGGRQISAKERDSAWAVIEAAKPEDSDTSTENGSA
tara:strand:+ start:290 stop:676 length:387 start_codon:yes stop_codon:yes gene_type:complete